MNRRRWAAGITGGILVVVATTLLQQQAHAERRTCDGDDGGAKHSERSRCEQRPEPKLRVEPYEDVGRSRVPPRSPDLGAAFNPLSPSIGPGSGLLGPEAGRGVLQPDPDPGRDKAAKKRRHRREAESSFPR